MDFCERKILPDPPVYPALPYIMLQNKISIYQSVFMQLKNEKRSLNTKSSSWNMYLTVNFVRERLVYYIILFHGSQGKLVLFLYKLKL